MKFQHKLIPVVVIVLKIIYSLMDNQKKIIKVRMPPCLRRVNDPSIVEVAANSLVETIKGLETMLPGINRELMTEDGRLLCSAFDFYVNNKSHRFPFDIPLGDGDEVIIMVHPANAGVCS